MPGKRNCDEIDRATEVFVRGFCSGRSLTYPYECVMVNGIRVMRDAPRKNARDYRKEEWIAYGVDPSAVDALARERTRGRYFVGAMHAAGAPDDALRAAYKQLGYRLLAREGLFVHDLRRIPSAKSTARVCQIRNPTAAAALAKAKRARPISPQHLGGDAPFRQYAAMDGEDVIGWVRSVAAGDSTWCSDMYVRETHRRRGVGTAMLVRMLRDDRKHDAETSVLLASREGALLYPRVGYNLIATLYIFAPRRSG